MPTQTRAPRSAPSRTGRSARTSTSGSPRRSAPRRTPPRRYGMAGGVLQRRKAPPQSNLQRALGGLSGLLPAAGRAGAKATPSSKGGKAGGFALLTAVAGLAFKNRDKLGVLTGRGERKEITTPATPPPTPPTSPA